MPLNANSQLKHLFINISVKNSDFSQKGVASVEQIKNWISDHYVMCVSAVIFIGCIIGGWLYYTASRTANDYHYAVNAVERTEAGLDRAGKRLESAQAEIKNAQKHIQRANEATGKLTERTKRDAEELDDCQHLVDRMSERSERIQRIIADVEKANKTDGTQTDSHA